MEGVERREEIERKEEAEEKEKYPNLYYWRKLREALANQLNVPKYILCRNMILMYFIDAPEYKKERPLIMPYVDPRQF